MSSSTTIIKVGNKGFGVVGNYPPSTWRYDGKRNGSHILSHVKHPRQVAAFPDQGVDWATVERIMRNPR